MAGLAKQFSKALQKHHQLHAAWMPISDHFAVGDYGLMESGVFRRLGNIKTDFKVDFPTVQGEEAQFDITSEGTTKISSVAGVDVPALPAAGSMEGSIKFGFNKSNSFVLKANVTSVKMDSMPNVAMQLVKHPAWNKKYKIVQAAYTGKDAVVIASASGGFSFGIKGSVDALNALNAGNANGDFSFENANKAEVKVVGKSGVVALKLFQISRKGQVDFLKELKEEDIDLKTLSGDFEDDI